MRPLLLLLRGHGRLAAAARRSWKRTPRRQRGPVLLLAAAGAVVVWFLPYGVPLAVLCLVAVAMVKGRGDEEPPAVERGPDAAACERLQLLYDALVPHFRAPEGLTGEPLYAYGGEWRQAITAFRFGEAGHLGGLRLRYPAYFADGAPECRGRIERLLATKAGRDREMRFHWDAERNQLEMTVLAPLPTGIGAQRFVTAPGETVLGFTDAGAVGRTLPVHDSTRRETTVDAAPVVWRTGVRSHTPHLLVVGLPGAGATSLLRSVALQGLAGGDVLLIDGSGAGEFACFAGRAGVLAAESAPSAAVAALEWAGHETERRLLAGPGSRRRPLWIVLDRPALLRHLARVEGARDPRELLEVPLRHGRTAGVTVVLAEQLAELDELSGTAAVHTRARVALGAVSPEQATAVLGASPRSSPAPEPPPGRGYARLGTGPVLRLQVPATPDPADEATGEEQRRAVLALLPRMVAAPERPANATDPTGGTGRPESRQVV